jgi:hypothetical protein
LKIGTDINEFKTEGLFKQQFFYNTQELKMEYDSFDFFLNNSPVNPADIVPTILDIYINNFSIYEVDKVPFFKFAEETDIDSRIKTPYFATAPFIDYSNANFDFIGNVNLTFDSEGITSQGVQSTGISVTSNSNLNGSFADAPFNSSTTFFR